MRILYHHRTLGTGAEGIHIREMVQAFRALGHEVLVLALIGDGARDRSQSQRWWIFLRRFIPASLYELAEIAYNMLGSRRVARAIATFRPDFVYDRYNSYSSAAVLTAVRKHIPVMLEVNAPVVYERTAYENLPLRLPRLALNYEKRIFTAATHLFAVSTPLKQFIAATHGVAAENISVVPNGVDPLRFRPCKTGLEARQAAQLPAATIIGFVGHARPWHGLELLLEAFAQLLAQGAHAHLLLLLGAGPGDDRILSVAQRLALGQYITYVDNVAHDEVATYIGMMDIAVSPRTTFYASPLKIVEYMAMAKAIVAPASPNIHDLVQHEQSALLFEPDNPASLAEALRRLAENPALRLKLGTAARLVVERQRNWMNNAWEVVRRAEHVIRRPAMTSPVGEQ